MFRYAMSGRWIGWHLFSIILVVVLVSAGVWQWSVAMSSVGPDGESNVNIRNLVYAMQWWVFAIFGVWFWLRFLRDQRDAELEEMLANSQEASLRDETAGELGKPGEAAETPGSAGAGSSQDAGSRISLDDSASVRRQRSRAALGDASQGVSEAGPSAADDSDSVRSSDSSQAQEGS